MKTTGKSAHAALPHTGIDALEATTKILNGLYEYRQTLAANKSSVPGIDHPTLVVGLISGGINTNVVPDECTIRVDRRLIPGEDGVQAEAEFRKVVEEAVKTTRRNKTRNSKNTSCRKLRACSGRFTTDFSIIRELAVHYERER